MYVKFLYYYWSERVKNYYLIGAKLKICILHFIKFYHTFNRIAIGHYRLSAWLNAFAFNGGYFLFRARTQDNHWAKRGNSNHLA